MPACLISVSSIFKNLTRHLSTPCTFSLSLSFHTLLPASVCSCIWVTWISAFPPVLCQVVYASFPVCSFVERNFGSFPPYRRREKSFFFLNRTIMRGSFLKCTPILEFFLCVRGVNKRARQNRYTEIIYLVEL